MLRPFCLLKILVYVLLILIGNPLLLEAAIERLVPQVVSKLPHNLPAFTQGLAIEEDQLYESTGLYGQSSLRHLNILTGEVIRKLPLSAKVFAEGIAVFPNQIVQLTWKEKQAFVYERKGLKLQHILFYPGEGWGLCRDGNTVWMSDGSSTLTQRDLATFVPLKTLQVSLNNLPIDNLNDLECVGNDLYANIWQKDWIVRIDKLTGEITGVIDATSLLSSSERKRLDSDEVLNGIAFRSRTGTFFLTGKGWPWIFEVRLIPQSQ
jgi:glutaminyl-peptide cyclotransferase